MSNPFQKWANLYTELAGLSTNYIYYRKLNDGQSAPHNWF